MDDSIWSRGGLSPECSHCRQPLSGGFAKCHACGTIREEFRQYASAISERITACIWSGAETDVQLPSGHSMWAPYFLGMIEAGWLDSSLRFTEIACEKHPFLRNPWTFDPPA